MKKIIASVGMAAVGTAGLQAANYGDLSADQTSKRWSASAAVRGFYDDNYATRPSGPQKRDSFGFEISPQLSFNLPFENSFVGLTYVYTASYYEDRADNNWDQSHDVRLNLDHRFNARNHINLLDNFVYSFEPTLLDQGATVTAPLRSDAEGLHNRAVLSFDTQFTPLWALNAGYENNYYDYKDSGVGSYSALLDRVEHLFRVDPHYIFSPTTAGFVGYQFGYVDYLSKEFIGTGSTVKGTDRDNYSHYGYVGAEHKVSSTLSVEGRAGVQFITYNELDESSTSPYLDVLGTYNYLQGSYLKLGFKYAHNATDVGAGAMNPDNITLDQETLTAYLSVNHRITALLTGGLLLQYQHSTYNGGEFDNDSDNYVTTALTLAYKLSNHWSVETSYYFDWLSSDIEGRDFTRNRVYAGVRGTY